MFVMVVDQAFFVVGDVVPLDHGYALYSALCRVLGDSADVLHENAYVGVHLIGGDYEGQGRLRLNAQSRVCLRMPLDSVPVFSRLAGCELNLSGCRVRLGVSCIRALVGKPALQCRHVTMKNGQEVGRFEAAVNLRLQVMGVAAKWSFVPRNASGPDKSGRRVVTIHNKKIVTYALKFEGLSDEESLKLQVEGLGGRRRMGCGLFR